MVNRDIKTGDIMTFPKKTYKKVSESWHPESILAPWIWNMSGMARRESLVTSRYILSFGSTSSSNAGQPYGTFFPKHFSVSDILPNFVSLTTLSAKEEK